MAKVERRATSLPATVQQAALFDGIPLSAFGIYVQEVGAQKPLLKFNEKQAMSPASTMKLLTTSAALNLLGPGYTWKTQVFGRGVLQGDVWQGDLIIRGSLDPKLVLENFWLLLRQLRAKGIREINGSVLLDRSIAPDLPGDAADFDAAAVKAYNVLPDALLLNYKTVRLQLRPDPARQNAQLNIEPPLAGLQAGALPLSEGSCDEWHEGLGLHMQAQTLSFGGAYPASCGERSWDIHPYAMSQDAYFGAVLRTLWQELGGRINGEITGGAVPENAISLLEWQSPPLAEVVRDINKFSNNVMARQLLLTLGIEQGKGASYAAGAARIRNWLAQQGVMAPELVIENGSGLSRSERIAPQSLARLLLAMYASPVMPELIASLPLAGIDGTMRNRLKQSPAAGHAHLKTGTLSDVRAVAGYVLAASGKRYVLVALVNHGRASESRAALDQLIEWLYLRG